MQSFLTNKTNSLYVFEMTLIITELSSLGIIMVGETAQTVDCLAPDHTTQERSFVGLVKVIPVPELRAGLSYWGWAKIPPQEGRNGIFMDWWLQNIVSRRASEFNSIEALAKLLEKELRDIIPRMTDEELKAFHWGNGGIHLAGFVETNGNDLPCFWSIHNGFSHSNSKLDPHIVNACYDVHPAKFDTGTAIFRNGDIEAYSQFFDSHLAKYLEEVHATFGIVMPYPDLTSRAEFWAAQIKFISALYEASGYVGKKGLSRMTKVIGDQVTTLTITEKGIASYFTR
jgi:hypothetical protein